MYCILYTTRWWCQFHFDFDNNIPITLLHWNWLTWVETKNLNCGSEMEFISKRYWEYQWKMERNAISSKYVQVHSTYFWILISGALNSSIFLLKMYWMHPLVMSLLHRSYKKQNYLPEFLVFVALKIVLRTNLLVSVAVFSVISLTIFVRLFAISSIFDSISSCWWWSVVIGEVSQKKERERTRHRKWNIVSLYRSTVKSLCY